jgi:hypothetical protein
MLFCSYLVFSFSHLQLRKDWGKGANMKWKGLASLLSAARLISSVQGAGTTVWVSVSYCPLPKTSLATGPGLPSGT